MRDCTHPSYLDWNIAHTKPEFLAIVSGGSELRIRYFPWPVQITKKNDKSYFFVTEIWVSPNWIVYPLHQGPAILMLSIITTNWGRERLRGKAYRKKCSMTAQIIFRQRQREVKMEPICYSSKDHCPLGAQKTDDWGGQEIAKKI